MHLVGFIVRIYHDARSLECQILRTIRRLVESVQHVLYFFVFNCTLLNVCKEMT